MCRRLLSTSSSSVRSEVSITYVVVLLCVYWLCMLGQQALLAPLLSGDGAAEWQQLLGQGTSSLLLFVVPVVVTERMERVLGHPPVVRWRTPIVVRSLPWLAVLLLLLLLLSEVGGGMMRLVPAPADWITELSDQVAKHSESLLSARDPLGRLLLLSFVCVCAPFGEELFFRGALQRWLWLRSGRMHAAVWSTALLFGLFHLEWHGLMSRLLMGALLGYVSACGSLWAAVLLHGLNNLVVLVAYQVWGYTTMEISWSWSLTLVVGLLVVLVTALVLRAYAATARTAP